ncbi:hypothetical protein AB1E18_009854 [Capra hircus]
MVLRSRRDSGSSSRMGGAHSVWGPQPLGSHIWGPAEKEGDDEERLLKNYLPATMEYALHMYNLTNQGRNAYKVVRVLRSWKDPVDVGLVFSMELEFT